MFDQERSSLEAYKHILIDVQDRQCFYCHQELRTNLEVDHFVPWSRYPTDLGHNFVLAHPRCNNSKSDYLAAEQHLESWSQRNRVRSVELDQRLIDAGLPSDSLASIRITEWAYEQVEKSQGTSVVTTSGVSALRTEMAGTVGGVSQKQPPSATPSSAKHSRKLNVLQVGNRVLNL